MRKSYSGPLVFARDMMVFDVTKEQVKWRMAVTAATTWRDNEFHDEGFKKLPRGEKLKMSQWLLDKVMFPKG